MEQSKKYCGGAELSYQCLMAEKRTKAFIGAIRKVVKKGAVVLEAGTGTGILSIVAANAGAKKVYAIEQNKLLIPQLKKNIIDLGLADKIEIIENDASEVKITEKVDVIICEMICAGLIDEPQIPVLNHLLKFLKKNGSVIPASAEVSLELAHDNDEYFGYKIPYLHFEDERRRSKSITKTKLFAKIDFNKTNKLKLSKKMEFAIDKTGIMNAIRISTKTELLKGLVLGECEAYCPVLVIPIKENKVNKGDLKKLSLSYELGGGMLTIKHKIS